MGRHDKLTTADWVIRISILITVLVGLAWLGDSATSKPRTTAPAPAISR